MVKLCGLLRVYELCHHKCFCKYLVKTLKLRMRLHEEFQHIVDLHHFIPIIKADIDRPLYSIFFMSLFLQCMLFSDGAQKRGAVRKVVIEGMACQIRVQLRSSNSFFRGSYLDGS